VHGVLDPITCEALGATIDFVLWRTLGGMRIGDAVRLTAWTNLLAIVAPFALAVMGQLE
jgi:hypothetical protein